MNIFFQPDVINGANFLNPDESIHCCKVLRLQENDPILVLDGKGGKYYATISSNNPKKCEFIITHSQQAPPPPYHIHIAISPTKNAERIEWFVEKSVEIGIQEISFLLTDNSERRHFKTVRVRKKAISAMKQSQGVFLPTINEPMLYNNFLERSIDGDKFIASMEAENPVLFYNKALPNKNYTILIGPEGDFSSNELDTAVALGYQKVSLGKNRLRTETAGVASCLMLNLVNQI